VSLDGIRTGAGVLLFASFGIAHIIWPRYFPEKRWRFQGWEFKNWSALQVRCFGIAWLSLLFFVLLAAHFYPMLSGLSRH
jgi:hypothetical protein